MRWHEPPPQTRPIYAHQQLRQLPSATRQFLWPWKLPNEGQIPERQPEAYKGPECYPMQKFTRSGVFGRSRRNAVPNVLNDLRNDDPRVTTIDTS
jgi:hypothetical protein